MSFKEMVEADNASVFLNLYEFAEIHNLNGTQCTAILQDISVLETGSIDDTVECAGFYGKRMLVNCRKSDLPEIPVAGQPFRIDNVLYLVETCAEDMGMLTIQLVSNNR